LDKFVKVVDGGGKFVYVYMHLCEPDISEKRM
jgi:hypothetical protein